MRRVIGGDAVDHALLQPGAQRRHVGRFPQRRIHLGVRVVALAGVIGQRQVVRRHLRGHAQTLLLGAADQLHRAARRHVAQMHVAAGELREQDVAPHHDLLRRGRDPLQSEAGGNEALVHDAARRERRLFAMIRDGYPEGAGVLKRRAHQVTRYDGLAVVRHGDGAGSHHLAELRQVFAALAHRNRPDRKHPREPGTGRLAHDEPDRRLVVGDGIGVRHGAHGRESARHGGARAARDGFDVFVPRLPQVHVHVHEARGDDFAAHVPHVDPVRGPERGAERRDLAVVHEHVGRAVEVAAGVDHPAALEQEWPHHSGAAARLAASASSGRPPASRYSTAIRTGTPFVT